MTGNGWGAALEMLHRAPGRWHAESMLDWAGVSAIQVKNVSEDLHERLRERAETEGMTIGQYVMRVIEHDLALPSRREWFESLRELEPVEVLDAPEAVRQGREEREEQLDRALRR